MRTLLFTCLLVVASEAGARLNLKGLQENVRSLRETNTRLESAPPAQQQQLAEQRGRIVQEIRGMADSEPRNQQAQIAVAQGFMSANEPKEATGFADRAVTLAQESGDNKALGTALSIGAKAYYMTGDNEAAHARSKRALELDPNNKTAMSVYQLTKGRTGATSAPSERTTAGAATSAPLPPVTSQTSGSGKSTFASTSDAPNAPPAAFVGAGTEKALKLTAEASRRWSLDKAAAMRLLEEAVAADAKNAAARAARARARLETGDAAGALEDADVALAAGPSAAMHAVKGEALLALGRKGEEMLSHFKAAAALDGNYSARYQELLAGGGATTGASAPDPSRRMGEKDVTRPSWLLPAAVAGLAILILLAFLLLRRRA